MKKFVVYLENQSFVRLVIIISAFITILVAIPTIYHWIISTQIEHKAIEPAQLKRDTLITSKKSDGLSSDTQFISSSTVNESINKNEGQGRNNISNGQPKEKDTKVKISCSDCNATGIIKIQTSCDACNGKGWVTCAQCNGTGKWGNIYPTKGAFETPACSKCSGTGKTKCPECLGEGKIAITKTCPKCNGLGYYY